MVSSPPVKKSLSSPLLYLLPVGGGGGGRSTTRPCDFSETMRRRFSTAILLSSIPLFLFAYFSLYSSRIPIYDSSPIRSYRSFTLNLTNATLTELHPSPVTEIQQKQQEEDDDERAHRTSHVASIPDSNSSPPQYHPLVRVTGVIDSVSILLPAWDVLSILPPDYSTPPLIARGGGGAAGDDFVCLYPNKETSPARFSGILPSTNQTTFTCSLPPRTRRRLPFPSPVLTRISDIPMIDEARNSNSPPAPELLKWNYLAYDSLSTEDDVVLLVKGPNKKQGINRSPREFRCVFFPDGGDAASRNAVRTAVTSSVQEVFRCAHPELTAFDNFGGKIGGEVVGSGPGTRIKVSLEIHGEKVVVPSVAYYTPWRKVAPLEKKSLLCACTMVYNVAKFLPEWVTYHSRIGVEKFILYDNDSDDDLKETVRKLNGQGYDVATYHWIWPKTQEAGFSHSAVHAKQSCTWMMYIDVDEFVFASSWVNDVSQPSDQMLASLLSLNSNHPGGLSIGQVSIMCNEFGPSNQRAHPAEGVTQGYDCRKRTWNRHKSVVLLEAVDDSLFNAIHHFKVKERKGYRWKQVSLQKAVVNHYKYQAWSEFKAKFRRRVSAYVVDWQESVNMASKDRTPGLGFEAVEPGGWEGRFCEVKDDRLKLLTRRWFGKETRTGHEMAWAWQ